MGASRLVLVETAGLVVVVVVVLVVLVWRALEPWIGGV